MTQQQLADKLSIKRETLSTIEHGLRALKDQEIVLLANALEISCDYLLTGVDTKNLNINKELGLTNSSIENLKTIGSDNLRILNVILSDEQTIDTFKEMLSNISDAAIITFPILQKKYLTPNIPEDLIKFFSLGEYYTLHAGRCIEKIVHQILNRKNPFEGLLTEKELEEYEQEES